MFSLTILELESSGGLPNRMKDSFINLNTLMINLWQSILGNSSFKFKQVTSVFLTNLCLTLLAGRALATDAGLANTPPMGWNCYHWFGTQPDEKIIKNGADGVVSSGLKAAGYIYVN